MSVESGAVQEVARGVWADWLRARRVCSEHHNGKECCR
jgi:hypothetical protein